MNDKLRKEFINNIALNPFNDKFNIREFEFLIMGVNNLDDLIELNAMIESFSHLHRFHKAFYSEVAKLVKSLDSNIENVIDLIFTVFNRNYLVVNDNRHTEEHPEDVTLNEIANRSVMSMDKSIGEVNIISALETDAEGLNVLCNLLRHVKDSLLLADTISSENTIQSLIQVQLYASIYYTLKSIYEDAVWNGGTFYYYKENKRIEIKFPDKRSLICHAIGHLRIQTASLQHYFVMKGSIDSRNDLGLLVEASLYKTKRDKKIKSVHIKDGDVFPKVAKKQSLKNIESELKILSSIQAYYPFIDLHSHQFSTFGLSVSDFVVLLSLIQEILHEVLESPIDTSFYTLKDINRYPIRFPKAELISYLKLMSTYTGGQIDFFLKSITSSFKARTNLWESVLFENNGKYLFSYVSLLNPMPLNLIDNWLECNGYPMKERGFLFEQYIKTRLHQMLTERKFTYWIDERSKITLGVKMEEIDVLFCVRDTFFVCEAKCIKYSTDARETHNAPKILKKAVEQSKRKCNFIKNNFKDYSKGNTVLEGIKNINPLVITNYPTYTWADIGDVPVVDFYLLEGFFSSGSISKGYFKNENKITRSYVKAVDYYYTNESEMNESYTPF